MNATVKEMMAAANAAVTRITPLEAREMMEKGNTVVIDVRDAHEVEKTGRIAGALHISRGMLEFRADPETPYHEPNLVKDRTVIVYCASGGRAALSCKLLKDMGYGQVYNMGGIGDWIASGGAVESK